jgi:hypothetical protein
MVAKKKHGGAVLGGWWEGLFGIGGKAALLVGLSVPLHK